MRFPLAFILAATLLAGCAGEARPQAVEAPTDPTLGAVAGVVVDEVGLPVEGAEIGTLGSNTTATSGADGRFRIQLAPGAHELIVGALGYAPARKSVQVVEGEAFEVEVMLVAIPKPIAGRIQVLPGKGFVSCSFTQSAFGTTLTQPCGWDSNNKPLFHFDVSVPDGLVSVVAEMSWTPSTGSTGQSLRLGLWNDPSCNARCDIKDGTQWGYVNGKSPLRLQVGNLTAPFRDGLEILKPSRLAAVVLVRDPAPVAQNPADYDVVFQQSVDFTVSVFYHRGVPDGYTALAPSA